jgi:hypothetical protein
LLADVIDDREQGYALLVSGDVASPRGLVYFDRSAYGCGAGDARVVVRDCDRPGGAMVTVRTPAGDCDRFLVTGGEEILSSNPFSIQDVASGPGPSTCAGDTPDGDGVVVTTDDSVIEASYEDAAPARSAGTTARVTCRDVRVGAAVVRSGCDPGAPAGDLHLGDTQWLEITLETASLHDFTGLVATLHPLDEGVTLVTPGCMVEGFSGSPTATVTLRTQLLTISLLQPCPSTLRFRLELTAADGFRDRAYFELPLADCTPEGPVIPDPGEVPDRDGVDAMGDPVRAVRVTKTLTGPVQGNVVLSWDRPPATDPVLFLRYNTWRGRLDLLWRNAYNHNIPVGEGASILCNLPETHPLINSKSILGDATWAGTPAANFYYLVTAETPCAVGERVRHGSWGSADHDGDGVVGPGESRPAGLVFATDCGE